ncbi:MAG: extracellular solute-binding protein [Anaerolineales bacterium]|nr:extracellular solute-binding protein [Anaerolineales bacterium]
MFLAILAACSAAPISTGETVTIHCVVITPYGFESLAAEIQAVAAAYFETSNITVQVFNIDPSTLISNLSGSEILTDPEWNIDVIIADIAAAPELAQAGIVRDLSPSLQVPLEDGAGTRLGDDFYQGVLATLRFQGRQVGLPAEIDPRVMYYNRELFQAARFPAPSPNWTLDDFSAAARALPAATVRFPFGSWGIEVAPFIYQSIETPPEFYDDAGDVLADPGAIQAIRWYTGLALIHNVMPTPAGLADYAGNYIQRQRIISAGSDLEKSVLQAQADLGLAVENGDVAMWMGSCSERGGKPKHWDFDWGMVPLPASLRSATTAGGWGAFVSSHTNAYDESLRWIDFLTTHTPIHRGLPVRRAAAENQAKSETDSSFDAILQDLEASFVVPEWQAQQLTGVLQEPLFSVYAGELSIDDALETISRETHP